MSQKFWSGKAKAVHGIMQPGVGWSSDPKVYSDGRLFAWEDRLAQLPELKTADFVLSDNLPGILRFRPDACLMGSFLWGDLLASKHMNSAEVQKYASYERDVLTRHKPPMVCVDALAMPAVDELCEKIGVGFMCPDAFLADSSDEIRRKQVAVLVGATAALAPELPSLFENLLETVDGPILTSQNLIREQDKHIAKHLRAFGFTSRDYAACSLVVCRPGVGTITECLAQSTPMVTLHESGNEEMEHNSLVLEKLGVGINIGPDLSCNRMQNAVVECLERSAKMRSKAEKLDRKGFSQAVSYFLNRIVEG